MGMTKHAARMHLVIKRYRNHELSFPTADEINCLQNSLTPMTTSNELKSMLARSLEASNRIDDAASAINLLNGFTTYFGETIRTHPRSTHDCV